MIDHSETEFADRMAPPEHRSPGLLVVIGIASTLIVVALGIIGWRLL